MDTSERSPVQSPRRFRRITRTFAVLTLAAGSIITYANAAVPDKEVGLEGCVLTWTAVQGSGSAPLGDVSGLPDSVPPSPDGESGYAFDTDEEPITLTGVTDLQSISLKCTGVNNSGSYNTSFQVRFGVEEPVTDATPLGTCVFADTNLDTSELGFTDPPAQFSFDLQGLQCDNPTTIRVQRAATTQKAG